MATISKCPITKSNAKIVRSWIVDKNSTAFKNHGGYHTGIDLQCTTVYSVCYGVVIELGMHDEGYYFVTVQYDKDNCVRYMHLKSESVTLGSLVAKDDEIGEANKYVHFEYLTSKEGQPSLPVRIDTVTFYKQNPTNIAKSGLGDSAGMDLYSAYQVNITGKVTVDYSTIDKYIITLDRNSRADIDFDKLKKIGLIGAMVEAGQLYDASHNRKSFRNPKLDDQIKKISAANLPHALYFTARATTLEEVNNELEELQFCIRHYPPMLGIWMIPILSKSKSTNTLLLQRYESILEQWGLKGKLGLYASRSQLNIIDWKLFQDSWYLWLIDPVKNLTEFDNNELLSPEFFMLKEGE